MNKDRTTLIKALAAATVVAALVYAAPAAAFEPAAQNVIRRTCEAYEVAKTVLTTAAVLALIIGLAPMLWGQVKVKWIISCLVACTLFTAVPGIVVAFASGAAGCS